LNQTKKTGQSDYLKQCLRESYFSLLAQKSNDSISVSAIVKLAGVSRMSFYRYYQNKDQLVQQYVSDAFNDFIKTVKQDSAEDDLTAATIFFGFFRSHKTQIKILIKQNLFHLLAESFSSFLQHSNLAIHSKPNIPAQQTGYYYQYASAGILQLAKAWVMGDMKESDLEMAQVLKAIKIAQGEKYT